MYTVKTATISEFIESKDAWNALAASMPIPSIFCTWEWIYTWWEHFGGCQLPILLFVKKDNELKGILPLSARSVMFRNGWKIGRLLTYCGSEELYSDHLDLIAAPEDGGRCVQAIMEFIESKRDLWDLCILEQLVENGNLMTWFINRTAGGAGKVQFEIKQDSAANYIPLSGSFESFIGSYDSRTRYNLRSRKKKLEEQGFYYVHSEPSKEASELSWLFDLHGMRAKVKGISSTFDGSTIHEFHKSLVRRISSNGWLSLRYLRKEGTIIAASYNFVYGGRVFSYQKGMDPRWSRYGPGKAIVYEAIQEAFTKGCTEYNFLRGMEEYKSDWTQQRRLLYSISLFNRTGKGMLSKTLNSMKNAVKSR
jgi:hypothetical protein